MSYFLMKLNNNGTKNKYYIDSAKFNLKSARYLEYAKILSLDEAWTLHYS